MFFFTADAWLTINVGDVNDNIPEFPQPSYEFTVPEAIPVGGSVVALTAVDEDILDNGKLTYLITSGDDNNKFYMDSIFVAGTGVVKINEVRKII